MNTEAPRTIRIRVLPPSKRRSRLIDNRHYLGGEEATCDQAEALEYIASGNCELAPGQELTPQEIGYLEARADPLWAAKHGKYPKIEDFA